MVAATTAAFSQIPSLESAWNVDIFGCRTMTLRWDPTQGVDLQRAPIRLSRGPLLRWRAENLPLSLLLRLFQVGHCDWLVQEYAWRVDTRERVVNRDNKMFDFGCVDAPSEKAHIDNSVFDSTRVSARQLGMLCSIRTSYVHTDVW